jgi:non-heme chloroperoxidase
MKVFKTSDGIDLAYSDEGEGNPVIFIAGYRASRHTWSMQTKLFVELGFRVLTLDRRSQGSSDRPNHGHRMSRHGKDLDDFINALNLSNVLLIGQSMGASTIWAYVSLFGDNLLRGIVSIDQTPKMLNETDWDYGMYNLNLTNLATFFDDPLPNPLYRSVDSTFLEDIAEKTKDDLPFDSTETKPLLLDHAFSNWLDVLPNVNVPVLFIAGKNSPFWPCEHAVASAKLCCDGRAEIINECGHAVNWEQPEACNDTLVHFIQQLK